MSLLVASLRSLKMDLAHLYVFILVSTSALFVTVLRDFFADQCMSSSIFGQWALHGTGSSVVCLFFHKLLSVTRTLLPRFKRYTLTISASNITTVLISMLVHSIILVISPSSTKLPYSRKFSRKGCRQRCWI